MTDDTDRLRVILDTLTVRGRAYCPRCDRDTLWWNACRDGVHRRMACHGCGIEEGDRLTADETTVVT